MTDFATLSANYDGSGLERSKTHFKEVSAAGGRMEKDVRGSAQKMSRSFHDVESAAKRMLAPLAAYFGGRAIVNEIATFEQSMSSVAAITRATGKELMSMRDIARDLGATTEFTAGQAAEGLKFLGMAGFEASEAVAALPDTLNLATAAGMDLGTAADIASNIMSGFGIAATDASKVTDILAAAASRSNTDVVQLGRAMKFAAPIAKSMGVSINDTAAAIGTLSDAGLQSSQAGTGLRAVLASLAGPSTKAKETFQGLGISLSEVNPTANNLSDILQVLRDRGLTAEQAISIFGREAASAALVLVEGSQRVREFGNELSDVEGEAKRMADTMRDNLSGDLKILASAMSGLVLTLGDAGLTGALRSTVQSATTFFDFLSSNVSLVSDYQGYIYAIAGAFVASYMPAVVGAAIATAKLVASLTFLKAALLQTGIGALVVGAGYLIQKFIELNEKTGDWGRTFELTWNVATEFFSKLWDGAKATGLSFQAAGQYMTASMVEAFAWIGEKWDTLYNGIADGWNELAGSTMGQSLGLAEMGLSNVGNQLLGIAAGWRQAGMASEEAISKLTSSASEPLVALEEFNRELNSTANSAKSLDEIMAELNGSVKQLGQDAIETGVSSSNAFNEVEEAAEKSSSVAKKAKDAWKGLRDANSVYTSEMERNTETLANSFSRTAISIVTRSKSASEAILDLFSNLAQMMLNRSMQQLMMALLGGPSGSNLVSMIFGLPSFDGGGHTGSGPRTGGIDGKGGFLAINHPNETIIDNTKAGSGQPNFNISIDATGSAPGVEKKIREEMEQLLAEYSAGSYDRFLRSHNRAKTENYGYRNG